MLSTAPPRNPNKTTLSQKSYRAQEEKSNRQNSFLLNSLSKRHFLLVYAGEPDLPVLAAHRRPSQVWGSAADDAALPASAQDLQAGSPDEEGRAGGSQGVQGDISGKICHRMCQVEAQILVILLVSCF